MAKLIIVDDHEALREGLEVMLGQGGNEVVGVAGNVAAAIDLVDVSEPDVAIVDIRLPDGSGIALTRELLIRRPGWGSSSTRGTATPSCSTRASTPARAGTR